MPRRPSSTAQAIPVGPAPTIATGSVTPAFYTAVRPSDYSCAGSGPIPRSCAGAACCRPCRGCPKGCRARSRPGPNRKVGANGVAGGLDREVRRRSPPTTSIPPPDVSSEPPRELPFAKRGLDPAARGVGVDAAAGLDDADAAARGLGVDVARSRVLELDRAAGGLSAWIGPSRRTPRCRRPRCSTRTLP